jgi:dienelactone hydrolase
MKRKGFWLKRVGLGLLVLLVGFVLLVGGLIAYDVVFGRGVTAVTNTSYPGPDGQTLHGYLARPDTPGPHPGVLLIHEWWGLNEDINIEAFERSLQQLNIPHTVTIYDGVGHAFLKSENIHTAGPARDAWQQMVAFLNGHLQ